MLHSSLSHPVQRSWTEPHLHRSQLMYPLFLTDIAQDTAIEGFAPNLQWGCGEDGSYHSVLSHLEKLASEKGLSSIMLFGVISDEQKNATGSMAEHSTTPVLRFLSKWDEAKKQNDTTAENYYPHLKNILVACDVCLCEYTDHGHCGVLKTDPHDESNVLIDNPKSIERLGRVALDYAKAGANMVCPSDMMDNRIGVIRQMLNEHEFFHVSIMAYTSKKASCMYAPFRQAVKSTFQGSRSGYQHPVGSTSHALKAYHRDVLEGADSVIVKPSLFYNDIIKELSEKDQRIPVVAYVVSGEYKMLYDYGVSTNSMEAVVREAHLGLIRAGAKLIITYFTPFILDHLDKW